MRSGPNVGEGRKPTQSRPLLNLMSDREDNYLFRSELNGLA